jgi:hypothetical protein
MDSDIQIDLATAYEHITAGNSTGVEMADMLYVMHPDAKHLEYRLLARIKFAEKHPNSGIVARMAKECFAIAPQHPVTTALLDME